MARIDYGFRTYSDLIDSQYMGMDDDDLIAHERAMSKRSARALWNDGTDDED